MAPITAAAFLEAHESRLQALEGHVPEMQALLAGHISDFTHLRDAIDQDLTVDVKEIKGILNKSVVESGRQFDRIDLRLARLEAIREDALEKRRVWQGRALAAVAVVLGAIGGKFGDAIYNWLMG